MRSWMYSTSHVTNYSVTAAVTNYSNHRQEHCGSDEEVCRVVKQASQQLGCDLSWGKLCAHVTLQSIYIVSTLVAVSIHATVVISPLVGGEDSPVCVHTYIVFLKIDLWQTKLSVSPGLLWTFTREWLHCSLPQAKKNMTLCTTIVIQICWVMLCLSFVCVCIYVCTCVCVFSSMQAYAFAHLTFQWRA